MPFLFALISINVLSVLLILVMCGKKENENGGSAKPTNKIENSQVEIAFTAVTPRNQNIYHEVAENLAFPASARCKNHDDAWRILALYLDYIRAVNPVEFDQFRMLDSALAVLHDFSSFITTSQIPNEILALAVIYFLVDFHKIKVKLGSENQPWYTALCRTAQIEEMEKLRLQIEYCLIGINENTVELES